MQTESLTWSEAPIVVAHDPPYWIAALNKSVEIKSENPQMFLQNVELAKLKCMTTIDNVPGVIYIASDSMIWKLKMVPPSKQVKQVW